MSDNMGLTNGYGSPRKYGNGYRVICKTPLNGSKVRISSDKAWKDTDMYEAGMAICDVKVFTTDREPLFENKNADLNAFYKGKAQHMNWDLPLAQVGQGKA